MSFNYCQSQNPNWTAHVNNQPFNLTKRGSTKHCVGRTESRCMKAGEQPNSCDPSSISSWEPLEMKSLKVLEMDRPQLHEEVRLSLWSVLTSYHPVRWICDSRKKSTEESLLSWIQRGARVCGIACPVCATIVTSVYHKGFMRWCTCTLIIIDSFHVALCLTSTNSLSLQKGTLPNIKRRS